MVDPTIPKFRDRESTPLVTNTSIGETIPNTVFDSSRPFYIHPSYSPGMMLVSSVFDEKGYGGWRKGVFIALSAKNKVGFIDGVFAQPNPTSDHFKYWSRCNDVVISWLLNSLS